MESGFNQTWVSERLREVIKRCGADADGMDACFNGSEASYMRLAESSIIQASDITRGKVSIRAIRGRSSARASTTDLSISGLTKCAERAILNATQTPPGDEDLSLPEPMPIETIGSMSSRRQLGCFSRGVINSGYLRFWEVHESRRPSAD